MKNIFFKVAIAAVIALTMMGGSALAGYTDLYGTGSLYDKEGNLTSDAFEAYSVTAWFECYDFSGNEETLNNFEVSFRFRDSDKLILDEFWLDRGWRVEYSDPFDFGEISFGEIGGFTFTADSYQEDYWYIEYNEVLNDGLQFINIYLNGWINQVSPITYDIQIAQNEDNRNIWEVWVWGDFDDLPNAVPPEVPEPGTMALLGTGLLGIAAMARRKMKK